MEWSQWTDETNFVMSIQFINKIVRQSMGSVSFHVHYEVDSHSSTDRRFYLRGNKSPLSWEKGIPFDGNELVIDFPSEIIGKIIEVKTLINDETWERGANEMFVVKGDKQKIDMYPWYGDQDGSLEIIEDVWSPELENKRNVIIFIPASFYGNCCNFGKNN